MLTTVAIEEMMTHAHADTEGEESGLQTMGITMGFGLFFPLSAYLGEKQAAAQNRDMRCAGEAVIANSNGNRKCPLPPSASTGRSMQSGPMRTGSRSRSMP
jgi:hypothetical protein